jgi:anti-sigma B factor antagonist
VHQALPSINTFKLMRFKPILRRSGDGAVSLQISIRESGDVTILDLRGKLTIDAESEMLRSHLDTFVANGVRKLLLNLGAVTKVDSAGLSVIARTCFSLRSQNGDLKLLCPGGRVLEVLRVLHLLETIASFEDENQALASFRPRGYFAKP